MKEYTKGCITVDKFLDDVYNWYINPMNRCVWDYHYSCAATMTNKDFRHEIREFLKHRMTLGEDIEPRTVPSWFIARATTKYIQSMHL